MYRMCGGHRIGLFLRGSTGTARNRMASAMVYRNTALWGTQHTKNGSTYRAVTWPYTTVKVNVSCYRPQMELREGNVLHLSVILFTEGWHDVTSCYGTPLTAPSTDCTSSMVNKQGVRNLLKCFLFLWFVLTLILSDLSSLHTFE